MILNQPKILEVLSKLLEADSLDIIRKQIKTIEYDVKSFKDDEMGLLNIGTNGHTISMSSKYLNCELKQISETHTLERTKYYINRLITGLTKVKTKKINDINLNRWKEYDDILTDSLWVLDKRDKSGAHNAGYWGNFIPQIPNQFIRRFTKQGEWVLDTFLGSGTTLIESRRLGRNADGISLNV